LEEQSAEQIAGGWLSHLRGQLADSSVALAQAEAASRKAQQDVGTLREQLSASGERLAEARTRGEQAVIDKAAAERTLGDEARLYRQQAQELANEVARLREAADRRECPIFCVSGSVTMVRIARSAS